MSAAKTVLVQPGATVEVTVGAVAVVMAESEGGEQIIVLHAADGNVIGLSREQFDEIVQTVQGN